MLIEFLFIVTWMWILLTQIQLSLQDRQIRLVLQLIENLHQITKDIIDGEPDSWNKIPESFEEEGWHNE